jgi:TonB family protein
MGQNQVVNSNQSIQSDKLAEQQDLTSPKEVDSSEAVKCRNFKDAEYPGGIAGLCSLLQKNLRYPKREARYFLQGKVLIEFEVSKTGEASFHKIKESAGAPFDREAIRLVSLLGKFKPATCNDSITTMRFTLPVTFSNEIYEDEDPYVIDDVKSEPRIWPVDAHDEYAEIFPKKELLRRMVAISQTLPEKSEPVYLGIKITIREDGTYDDPEVTTNSAMLDQDAIVRIIKMLPNAKPAKDYGKPVASRVFLGFTRFPRSKTLRDSDQ